MRTPFCCRISLVSFFVAFSATSTLTEPEVPWHFEELRAMSIQEDGAASFPVQLMLDDGTAEGVFGLGGATAQQFLWFNQFALPGGFFDLHQIQVLFPSGPNMAAGKAIDLVVFHDADGDPTNGANWLATYPETIQSVTGTDFSTYAVDPPIHVPPGGDQLVGVVPRFVVSGVTTQTNPATLDTTSSQRRSWIAIWTGDPPSPPDMPPNLLIDRIDVFVAGNWMIRASGGQTPVTIVPTLGPLGLLLLVMVMGIAGVAFARRKRSS